MARTKFRVCISGKVVGWKADAANRLEYFKAHFRQWQEIHYPDIVIDYPIKIEVADGNGGNGGDAQAGD